MGLFMLFGCSTNKPKDFIEVPEFVDLSKSPLYNGENPTYIYEIDEEDWEETDYIEDFE